MDRIAGPRSRALPCGLAMLALLCAFGPAPFLRAQVPGVIEPFDQNRDLFNRATEYFRFGRGSKDVHESRRALRMAIPLYRQYLNSGARGVTAQQAWHELGMALLLTGELQQGEHMFRTMINRYRAGHWVAESAYRLAAQLYNRQEWNKAAAFFEMATREAGEPELRHKSAYYEARCLTYSGKNAEAIKRLERIINDPGNPFRENARLSIGQLYAAAGKHKEALESFELLLKPTTSPQERAQALLAAGVSAAKLGQHQKAENFLFQTLDAPGLAPKYKARAQHSLMEMRFKEDNHAEVVKIFRRGEFVGENPIQAQIYMMAGKSLAHLDRHNEAIRQFFNAERLAPLTDLGFEASFRRLSSFYKVNGPNIPGQVDAFVKIYAPRMPAHPWLHEARLMKAEILFHQGSLVRAAAAYNDINATVLPEELRGEVYFKRGWCLSESGEFNRAVGNLSSFINKYPDHPRIPEALAKRGHAYLQLGDRGSALKDFQGILAAGGDETLAAFARQHCGRIHREDRNYDKMVASYQALLKDHANLKRQTIANANYWIGWGLFKLEKWKECVSYLEAARTLIPSHYKEPAGTHIVLAAYSMLDSDLLATAVRRLLADSPGQRMPSRMLIWLGLERFTKGDYTGADEFLSLASTPDEPGLTDIIVWRHLGKARIEIRHFDRALDTLAILLELDQEDFWKADAYLDQSHAFIGAGEWEKAREAAHEGLQLDPQGTVQAGLYMALADVAMHRKDFESAAASYLRTAEMFVDDNEIKPLSLHRAAEAFEKNGQLDEATRIRKKLSDEFPDWKIAREP